jgi:hypothetical protein
MQLSEVLLKWPAYLREQVRYQEMVVAGCLVGIAIMRLPLQRHIALALFQHRAISVAAIALSFLLQAVISWRTVSIWGRMTLVGSSLFLGIFSWYFWNNPWLGNPDLATNRQLFDNRIFGYLMFIGFCGLMFVWIRWWLERHAQIELAIKEAKEHVLP